MPRTPPEHRARAAWVLACLDYLCEQHDENNEFLWVDLDRLVSQFTHLVPMGMAARRLVSDRYYGAHDTESDMYPARIVMGQKRVIRHSLIRSAYVEVSKDKKQVRYSLRYGRTHV